MADHAARRRPFDATVRTSGSTALRNLASYKHLHNSAATITHDIHRPAAKAGYATLRIRHPQVFCQ
jgi:hypothetical protein